MWSESPWDCCVEAGLEVPGWQQEEQSRGCSVSPWQESHHQGPGLELGNYFCHGFGRKIDGLLLGLGLTPEAHGSASEG